MIQTNQLSKAFDGIEALCEFDLELQPGKITALIGPNGAGKTTLFNLITGFLSPTTGQILWSGSEINGIPPHRIARMGISRTFQEIRLFRSLTVLDNLLMSMRRGRNEGLGSAFFRRKVFKRQAKDNTEAIKEQLYGLQLQGDNPASALSYGQSKLVEILRASLCNPSLLLLDEPVAGLNPKLMGTVADFLTKISRSKKTTVFFIEHNMSFVFDLADWVIVLDHGTKLAEGPPEKVRNDPKVLEAYLC